MFSKDLVCGECRFDVTNEMKNCVGYWRERERERERERSE
jgi:hypothetical protein